MTLGSGVYSHNTCACTTHACTHTWTYTYHIPQKEEGKKEKKYHKKVELRVESSKLCTFWQLNSIRCILEKKLRPWTQFPSFTIRGGGSESLVLVLV